MSIIEYIKFSLKNLFFGKEREFVGEYLINEDLENDDTESYVLSEEPREDIKEKINTDSESCMYLSFNGSQSFIGIEIDDNLFTKFIPDKQTAILMPVANKIEPPVEEALKELESLGFKVYRQTGYSAIDQARNRMIYYALYEFGHPSVLWIDSDVVFKVEDVLRIIEHDLPVCAGAYPFKNPYTRQMTITMLNDEEIEFGSDKLVEIECAATGFLFIKKEVCDKIIEKYNMPLCNTSFDQGCYPVFKPDFWNIKGHDYYLGEDYSFCMRARECGYKIMLDPSIKLGHIGSYVYSWEDVHYGHKPEVKSFKFKNSNHKHNS